MLLGLTLTDTVIMILHTNFLSMQPDRAPNGCACPIAGCVVTRFTPPLLYCKCGQQATRPINCKCPAKTHKLVILDPMATCVKLRVGREMMCDDIGGGAGDDLERVAIEHFILEDVASSV